MPIILAAAGWGPLEGVARTCSIYAQATESLSSRVHKRARSSLAAGNTMARSGIARRGLARGPSLWLGGHRPRPRAGRMRLFGIKHGRGLVGRAGFLRLRAGSGA